MYTPKVHKETVENIRVFLASDVSGNVGMFKALDDPTGGRHIVRAAGTLMGHLGFLIKDNAYYILARYYGPTAQLNGNTAKDIIYKGTPSERKFETVKF